MHSIPVKDQTRQRVIDFYSNISAEGWDTDGKENVRTQVEKQADMISNFLLRVIPQLSSNHESSIVKVIRNTIGAQKGQWDDSILEAWPGNFMSFVFSVLLFTYFFIQILLRLYNNTYNLLFTIIPL